MLVKIYQKIFSFVRLIPFVVSVPPFRGSAVFLIRLVSNLMVTRKTSQLKMTVDVKSRSLKILQWSFLCLNVLVLVNIS